MTLAPTMTDSPRRPPPGPMPAAMAGGSPFIPISARARLGIIVFVLIYQVFTPAALAVTHGIVDPYVGVRMLVNAAYWLLVLAPLFLYRRDFGWLHPLIFPLLFDMFRLMAKSPAMLFSPLSVMVPGEEIELPILLGLPLANPADTSIAMIKAQLALVLAVLCYYVGYFLLPRLPARTANLSEPKALTRKVLVAVGVGIGVLLIFMLFRGGLVSHLTSLSFGRFRSLNVWAPVTVIVNLAPYAVAIWAAYKPRAVRNPVFWAVALVAVTSVFIATASRGSMIQFMAIIVICFVARWRKIPVFRAALAVPAVFLLLGVLGLIRSSAWEGGTTTLQPLREKGLAEIVRYTNEHVAAREAASGHVPVIARVPQDIPHLNGLSYGNIVGFFVPRAVWHDKPRGVGHHYAVQFLGKPEDGNAVPIGEVAEAYWNFGIPGIVLIFALFGAFHRQLVRMVVANQQHALTWVILATSLIYFTPGSSVVRWIQGMALIFVLAFAFGIFKRRARARYRPPLDPKGAGGYRHGVVRGHAGPPAGRLREP